MFKTFVFAFIVLCGISTSTQAQSKFNKGNHATTIKDKVQDRKNQVSDRIDSIDPVQVQAQLEAKLGEIQALLADLQSHIQGNVADYLTSNCADVTHTEATKTVLINFGSEPCVSSDGKTRQGSITIQYVGSERTPHTDMVVTFDGYVTNGYGIDGTLSYTTLGRNAADQLQLSLTASNVTITHPSGQTANATADLTVTWVNGEATDNPLDDVFQTTGSITGTLFDGTTFESATTTPVQYKLSCASQGNYYAVSGIRTLSTGGGDTYSINYGAGMCDSKAIVTVNGFSQPITLP